jgi:Domain of unknown function (DUF2382)
VQTVTDTVEELARADMQRETVEVTRVPVDKMVETAPEIRTEDDVTIVPVLEEVLVVEKRLVLKEELHIRRRVATEAVEVPVSLRKQRCCRGAHRSWRYPEHRVVPIALSQRRSGSRSPTPRRASAEV